MATDGVLRGLGIMRPFLVANIVNLAIRLSVALICAPRFGIAFVWLAVPVGWLANFLISYVALRRSWSTDKMASIRWLPVCRTRFQQGLGQTLSNKSTIEVQQMSERWPRTVTTKGRVSSWRWYPAFCAISACSFMGECGILGLVQQIGIWISTNYDLLTEVTGYQ